MKKSNHLWTPRSEAYIGKLRKVLDSVQIREKVKAVVVDELGTSH